MSRVSRWACQLLGDHALRVFERGYVFSFCAGLRPAFRAARCLGLRALRKLSNSGCCHGCQTIDALLGWESENVRDQS